MNYSFLDLFLMFNRLRCSSEPYFRFSWHVAMHLHHCWPYKTIKMQQCKQCSTIRYCLALYSIPPCDNLMLPLPTMQLGCHQLSCWFGCLTLVAAYVALSCWGVYRGLVSSLPLTPVTNFLSFSSFIFSPNWCCLEGHNMRQFIRFHAAPFGATKALYVVFNICSSSHQEL